MSARRENLWTRVCLGAITWSIILLFVSAGLAAPPTIEELASLKGKDREKILMEGAKKEKALAVYSAMNARDSKPLVDAFQKKYPFVKVDLFAGRGEDVVNRLMTEQRGGRFAADTFDAPTINTEKLRREGLLLPYYTPAQEIFNKKNIDPDRYWVPTYFNILTFVYNDREIKEPPQKWEDLLEPKWKGKMAIEDTDEVWLINFYKLWGEAKAKDYFTRLGKQDLRIVHGHSVMMQLMIAGEVAATPTQYLHQAVADRKKGAPVNYVSMDPMVVGPQGISLMKKAPHPYAALLFIDFATSREGQTLIDKRGRPVAYPGVTPYLKTANLLTDDPAISLDKFEHWQQLYKDLLIKPNRRR